MGVELIDHDDNLVFGIIKNNILNGNLEYKKAKVGVIGSGKDLKNDINTELYIIKVDTSGFDENLIEEAIVKMSRIFIIEDNDFKYSSSIPCEWCKEENWLQLNVAHFLFYNIFKYNL